MAHKYHLSSIIPYLQPTHPLPPPFAFTMAHKYHLSSIIPYLQPTHPLPPPFAFTMAHENVFYAGQHPSRLQISVFNFTTSLHHSLYVWYKMVKLKFHDVARIKEYVVTCLIVFFPKFIPFRLSKWLLFQPIWSNGDGRFTTSCIWSWIQPNLTKFLVTVCSLLFARQAANAFNLTTE